MNRIDPQKTKFVTFKTFWIINDPIWLKNWPSSSFEIISVPFVSIASKSLSVVTMNLFRRSEQPSQLYQK